MTEEQKQAVLARDLNWCMRTGGNIYFLAKIGATDGKASSRWPAMTGMTEQEYRDMMIGGGRSIEGKPRYLGEDGDASRIANRRGAAQQGAGEGSLNMAHHRLVYTSHVPAIGAAMDLGKTQEPYWQPVFRATSSPGGG